MMRAISGRGSSWIRSFPLAVTSDLSPGRAQPTFWINGNQRRHSRRVCWSPTRWDGLSLWRHWGDASRRVGISTRLLLGGFCRRCSCHHLDQVLRAMRNAVWWPARGIRIFSGVGRVLQEACWAGLVPTVWSFRILHGQQKTPPLKTGFILLRNIIETLKMRERFVWFSEMIRLQKCSAVLRDSLWALDLPDHWRGLWLADTSHYLLSHWPPLLLQPRPNYEFQWSSRRCLINTHNFCRLTYFFLWWLKSIKITILYNLIWSVIMNSTCNHFI